MSSAQSGPESLTGPAGTRKYGRLHLSALVLGMGMAFTSLPALAQEPVDTVTVTAQFREQNLQEVPNAITAFTTQDIEDAGIRETADFIGMTPNVTLDDSFTYLNSFVVIRGVTQINNADSPVAIVVDGVPQNNQKQFKMPMFDVQQIEILKGPQGALYGRNAIGGAINIVTKQPTNEFESFTTVSLSNGKGRRVEGGTSGPVVEDKLLFRLAGSYYEQGGLIENRFLGSNVDFVDHDYALRGKLAFMQSDTFTLDLRASYNDFKAGSSYDTIVNSKANDKFRGIGDANNPNTIFAPTSNMMGITEGDILELTAKADWELDFATATYILGYTDLEEQYRADLDFSNAGQQSFASGDEFSNLGQGQDLTVKTLSQELRLVSPDDQLFRWLGGVYYLDTERDLETRGFRDANGLLSQYDATAGRILHRKETNENTAWALFGQVETDITERMTLQLGARYDEDEREQSDPLAPASKTRTRTYSAFQPKATLSYAFQDDVLGYATYSTGFRSGGFNGPGTKIEAFKDETLTNYELGLKSRFMGGRAIFNLAGFYSQSNDFQFFFVDITSLQQIIANLDEVDIMGLDADFRFRLNDRATLYGGFGYTDSDIQSVGNHLVGVLNADILKTAKGSRTPKTTRLTLNLGAQVTHSFQNGMDAVLRADYEYQGRKYWQIDNKDVRDPIGLLSLRATLTGKGNWSASLWGKNLFDEEYYSDFNPSEFAGNEFDLAFQARPLTFGLDMSYKF